MLPPPNILFAFMEFDDDPMEKGLPLLLAPIEFDVGVAEPVLYMLITSLTKSSVGFTSMLSLRLASMIF